MAKGFRMITEPHAIVQVGARMVPHDPQRGDLAFSRAAMCAGTVVKVSEFAGRAFVVVELDDEAKVVTLFDGVTFHAQGWERFVPSDKYTVSSEVKGPVVVTRFYQTVFAEWSPGNGTRYTAMANNVGHCGLSEGVGEIGLVEDRAILLTYGNNGVGYFASADDKLDPLYIEEKWKVRGPDLDGAVWVLTEALKRCRA